MIYNSEFSTNSSRAEYFSARRTTPSPFTPQWAPRKSPRAQPPHIPNQTDGSFQLASKSIKMNSATTEDLLSTTGKVCTHFMASRPIFNFLLQN